MLYFYRLNEFVAIIDVSRYHRLLDEIHQCYLDQREQLLRPSITSTITDLTNQNSKDHCALVRDKRFKAQLPFKFSKVTFELTACGPSSLQGIFCRVWCRHKAVHMINEYNLGLCTADILSCFVKSQLLCRLLFFPLSYLIYKRVTPVLCSSSI